MAFTTTLAMAEAFRIPAFRIPFSCANLLNVKHASQFCPAFVGTSLRQSSYRGLREFSVCQKPRFLRIQSSSRSRPATLGHGHLAITASTESSETEEVNDFASLGLDYRLVDALTKMGFTKPTRVQHESIPSIVKGTDVVMGAETGSGKTLAYLLPLFHQLLKSQDAVGLEYDNLPEALVLVPNQELANQVMLVLQSFQVANPELSFPAIVLAGAGGLPRSKQCAVCIATASAVLRHTEPEFFDNTTYVVVDEADMMLDGGFVTDVIRILDFIKPRVSNTMRRRMPRATEAELEALLPRRPAQVVFAAATLPDWTGDKVKSVVRWLRKQYPAAAHINTDRLHLESDRVEQQWVDLGPDDDPLAAMAAALDRVGARRSMVFVNTVARAKEAQAFLESLGRPAQAVHKEVPAAERAAALQAFRAAGEGERAVLVCTDLAARGLDIPAVGHVVQLDFALSAVAHLHRVGRTGRAGAGGLVTNLVDERSRAVAEAIRNEAGLPLAPIFSRNRGFRRRLRRTGTGRAQIDGPAAAASGEPSSGAARRVSSPRRAGKGDGLGDASDEQAAPGPQSPSQAAA